MSIVKRDGFAFAIGRDGGVKRFNRADCTSYKNENFFSEHKHSILHHHTPSGAWILEDAGTSGPNVKPKEIEDVDALEWILGHLWEEYEGKLDKLWALFPTIREFTKVPASEKKARIIKKCKCFLERERLARASRAYLRSDVDMKIVEVLQESDHPLLGKEIASKAGLESNSHFRARLARLKECGITAKLEGKIGYTIH